jgi:hypothetical protein
MRRNQISKERRQTLLKQLQERYGLTVKEATQKTEAWLQWVQKQPAPQPHVLTAEVPEQHPSSRNQSLIEAGKPRSRSAARH